MNAQQIEEFAEKAIETAAKWQDRANRLLTHEEEAIREQMRRLLTHPMDKVVLSRMIDQSFRPRDPGRVADQVNSILKKYGTPDFFSSFEKVLMQMFIGFGRHVPALSVPKFIEKMRESSSRAAAIRRTLM